MLKRDDIYLVVLHALLSREGATPEWAGSIASSFASDYENANKAPQAAGVWDIGEIAFALKQTMETYPEGSEIRSLLAAAYISVTRAINSKENVAGT